MTMASTKTANRARLDALVGLVARLDEYIAVMGEELNDTATLAVIHGWRSTRVAQGRKLRREIAALRRKANAALTGGEAVPSNGVVGTEHPHPMLCFQHGGSEACEAVNRQHGFSCPKCSNDQAHVPTGAERKEVT